MWDSKLLLLDKDKSAPAQGTQTSDEPQIAGMQASQKDTTRSPPPGYQANAPVPSPRRPLFVEKTTHPILRSPRAIGPVGVVTEALSRFSVSRRNVNGAYCMDRQWQSNSGFMNPMLLPIWSLTESQIPSKSVHGAELPTSHSTDFLQQCSTEFPTSHGTEFRTTHSTDFPPRNSLESRMESREFPLPLPLRRDESEIFPLRRRNIPDVTTTTPEKICNFCKTNGEMKRVYLSHKLMEKGKIVCPVLRRYICPLCGATGDNAHTLSYCPFGSGTTNMVTARTPRKSCGCKRACRHGQQRHH